MRGAVRRASGALDRLVPRGNGITVLIYHRVGGGTDSSVDLPTAEFAEQMAHLSSRHRVLSLDDATAALAGGVAAPAVVVTFDDGTTDFADNALPVLVDHRVPATLYAATHFIDQRIPFPWGAPPASWPQLAEAVASGRVTVGSHSHRHLLFDRIDWSAASDEVTRSIDSIQRHLGAVPAHFAYPKAIPPAPATEVVVRSSFASAALAGCGANGPGADLHRLRRTPVQRGLTLDRFEALCTGAGRFEGLVRERTARWRYRGATA